MITSFPEPFPGQKANFHFFALLDSMYLRRGHGRARTCPEVLCPLTSKMPPAAKIRRPLC